VHHSTATAKAYMATGEKYKEKLDDQQAAVLATSANSTMNADSDGASKFHRIHKATTI